MRAALTPPLSQPYIEVPEGKPLGFAEFEPPWLLEVAEPSEVVRRMADKVAAMIVTSTYSDLDCALAERELRMECLRLLPEKMSLYDLVYTSRFRRLREQFRP